MNIGGTHYSEYELQYIVLAFYLFGVALAGIAAYAYVMNKLHSRRLRVAASCGVWALGAFDCVFMVYIGIIHDYPILTWSWLEVPRIVPIIIYTTFLLLVTASAMQKANSRYLKLHG